MFADRSRVILLAVLAVGLMLISAIGLSWFTLDGTGIGLGASNGLFGDTALYSALIFSLVVLLELGGYLLGYELPLKRVRWGYGVGATAFVCAIFIAYIMPPEVQHVVAHRTWAPLVMMVGSIAGIMVGYYATGGGEAKLGDYKPIVVAKPVVREPLPTPPGMKPLAHLRGKLAYSAMTAQLSRAGIEARLEDGEERLVMWADVIGIVARRMPETYAGLTFLDVVSTANATIRLVPWTRYTGESIDVDPRALAKQLAAWCPSAMIDPATGQFLDGHDAGQLPDLATLAAHDERLA